LRRSSQITRARAISGHLIRKAGLTRATAVTGAVTLIQRFGSAFNLNVHFHLLGHSIAYGIATGAREGQKVFTLQTLRAEPDASRRIRLSCHGTDPLAKPGEAYRLDRNPVVTTTA
jgi:hypothetical protein